MENFTFYAPTYFDFGKDTQKDCGKLAHTCCYGNGNTSGKISGFMTLDQKDVENIYRLML